MVDIADNELLLTHGDPLTALNVLLSLSSGSPFILYGFKLKKNL